MCPAVPRTATARDTALSVGLQSLKKTKNLGSFYQEGMGERNSSSFWPKHTSVSWKDAFLEGFSARVSASLFGSRITEPFLIYGNMGHLSDKRGICGVEGAEIEILKLCMYWVDQEETTVLHSSMGIINKPSEFNLMSHVDAIFTIWMPHRCHPRPCTLNSFNMDWLFRQYANQQHAQSQTISIDAIALIFWKK